MKTEEIIHNFIDDDVLSFEPVGEGHINDTYAVTSAAGKFICQRVKGSMDAGRLLHNFELYSEAFRAAEMFFPDWIKNRDGKYFLTDENGDNWRMYPLIDGDILSAPLEKEILCACGEGLAKMHMILGKIKEKPEAVYSGLRNLKFFYDEYSKVLSGVGLVEERRDRELEAIIESKVADMLAVVPAEQAPVHGDPKLSNILFKDGKVIGFIDMDTVMLGSKLEDLADCIRSCCVTDGRLDKEAAQIIADGYASATGTAVAPTELKRAFDKICFELAIRYYTDEVSGTGHFKEHYSGYRLEKARTLINTTWDR